MSENMTDVVEVIRKRAVGLCTRDADTWLYEWERLAGEAVLEILAEHSEPEDQIAAVREYALMLLRTPHDTRIAMFRRAQGNQLIEIVGREP